MINEVINEKERKVMGKVCPSLDFIGSTSDSRILMFDYSGLSDSKDFEISKELEDIIDLVNKKLLQEISEASFGKTFYVDDNYIENQKGKIISEYNSVVLENVPSYRLNKLAKIYGNENISKLFNDTLSGKQIKECINLLEIGNLGDISLGKNNTTLMFIADNLYGNIDSYDRNKETINNIQNLRFANEFIARENNDFKTFLSYVFNDNNVNLEELAKLDEFYKADASTIEYLDQNREDIDLYRIFYTKADAYNINKNREQKIDYRSLLDLLKLMKEANIADIDKVEEMLDTNGDRKEVYTYLRNKCEAIINEKEKGNRIKSETDDIEI